MDIRLLKRFQEETTESYTNYFEKISKWKLFYLRIFPKLMNTFKRNKGLSMIIIIVQQIQEADLVMKANSNFDSTKDNFTGTIVNIQDYFMLKDEQKGSIDDSYARYALFVFSFTYNLALIFITIISALVYQHNQYRSHSIKMICRIYSFLVKIYNYLFFLPFLAVSLQILYDNDLQSIYLLGYANILMTMLLGIIINIHDFDYSFKVQDYLSRRKCKLDILRQILVSLVVLLNSILDQKLICIAMFIYSLIKLFMYHQEQFYTFEEISLLYQSLSYMFASYAFVMLVRYVFENDNVFLFMLVAIPLCYKLAQFIQKKRIADIYNYCIGKTDLNHMPLLHVDIYVRQLIKNLNFFYEDYIEKGQALVFENIFINHTQNCQVNSYKCFCFEFKRDSNEFNLQEYIGQEYRRKYVIFYIVDIFEKYIDNQIKRRVSSSAIMFIYISFLFEILNISTKSFSELYSYQTKLIKLDSNAYDMYYTQILLSRSNRQFQHFFQNSVIQNQRLYMMSMILFDEQIDIFKRKLKSYLQQIGEFFDFLCSNYIDLRDLEKRCLDLDKENKQLQYLMKLLYDLNPESRLLNFLSTIYTQVIDFQNRRTNDLVKYSKRLPQKDLLPDEKNIKVFVKNSCVVYASLNTFDGKIMKVSKSFQDVYNIENKIILGKTINQLIPKGLYGAHDDFMKNFRNKGTMNVIMKGERLVFGLNGRGFIFPLMIRLKLENMFGEFGVCSHLTQVNLDNDYLFFSNEGNILDISENLFQTVFSSVCSLSDLRLLNINHIIPLIFGIQQLEQYGEEFYSILVVKKRRVNNFHKQKSQVTSLQMIDTIVNHIRQKDSIYNITFKMNLIPTSLGLTFKFVEISSFQKETNFIKKQESVAQLKDCIKVFIDFKNESEHFSQKLLHTRNILENKINSLHIEEENQNDDEKNIDNTQKQSSFESSYTKSLAKQGTNLQTESMMKFILQNQQQQQQNQQDQENNNNNNNGNTNNNKIYDKNEMIEKILSPFAKQTTYIIPQSEVGVGAYNQSTGTELPPITGRETVNGDNKIPLIYQEYQQDNNQIIQTNNKLLDEQLSDLRQINNNARSNFDITSLHKDFMNNLSPRAAGDINQTPRDSIRNLITSPKSQQFDEFNYTNRVKFNQQFDFYEQQQLLLQQQQTPIQNQVPIIPFKKLLQQQEEMEAQDQVEEQNPFSKEQKNTYKQLISNKLEHQQKIDMVKISQQQLSNSQLTLKQYNEQMKMYHSKSLGLDGKSPLAQKLKQQQMQSMQEQKKQKQNKKLSQLGTLNSSSLQQNDGDDDDDNNRDGNHHEITSLRSSMMSINEQRKKQIIKQIFSKANTNGLLFFIFTGIFSFSTLILIVSILHQQRFYTLNNYNINFQSLNLFNTLLTDIIKCMSSFSYYRMTSANVFLMDDKLNLLQIQQTQYDLNYYQKDLFQMYSSIMNLNNNLEYQQYLFNKNVELTLHSSTLSVLSTPVIYIFPIYIASISRLNDEVGDFIDLYELWDNYSIVFNTINFLQLSAQEFAIKQFSYIDNLMYSNVFIILGVSLFISSTLIPLSIAIKKQKENILKLFGSFLPEKMQKYIDLIEYCIYNIDLNETHSQNAYNIHKIVQNHKDEDEQQYNMKTGEQKKATIIPPIMMNQTVSMNHTMLNQNQIQYRLIKRQAQKRNRSIASFNSLPKLNKVILLWTVIIVSLLMIFPVVNSVMSTSFKEESNELIKQRIAILDLLNYVHDNQANHYTLWYFSLFGLDQPEIVKQINYNYNQTVFLASHMDQYHQTVQNLIINQSSFKYNSQLYNDFFVEILNNNICTVMQKYSMYFNPQALLMDCNNISQSIFQKGLILSYQQFFQQLNTFQQFYSLDPTVMENFYFYLIDQQKKVQLVSDFNNLVRFLMFATVALDNFLVQYEEDYYNEIRSNQDLLFILQIITITLLFSIGWQILYHRMRRDLTKSKSLLSLFHINLILENNLFMVFLKQNLVQTNN